MKVWLVLPPRGNINYFPEPPDQGWWMPLGLLSVGTYLLSQVPDTELEIFDGEVQNPGYIENRIQFADVDIIGFSPNICNHPLTLKWAESAKNRGATVVFGGHHATVMADQILSHLFVDFVVRGDGEVSFTEIAKGTDPSQISNLSYRKGEEIIHNPIDWLALYQIPPINYGLLESLPHWAYWAHHACNYPLSQECPYKKHLTIISQYGCLWRELTGGCIICSRKETFWRGRNVIHLCQEIARQKRAWGIDSVIDVSDDILTSILKYPYWFEEFYQNFLELEVGLRFAYARPDLITPKTANQLGEMGAWAILLGTESGSELCLRTCRKGFTVAQQINAVQLLTERNIYSSISFVIGLPDEDWTTLIETYKHIKYLLEIGMIDILFVNILNPTPGSPAWHLLLNTEEGKHFSQTDILSMEEIQRAWVKKFCWVSYEELQTAQQEMLALKPGSVTEYRVDRQK